SEITGAKFLELDITKGVTFEGEDDGDDEEPSGEPFTFGNNVSDSSSESHAERIMVSSAVAPSSGTVQSAVARLWLASAGDIEDDHTDAIFVIYAEDRKSVV